jgi:hypothetical protein
MRSRTVMLPFALLPVLLGLGLFLPHKAKQSTSSLPAKSSKTVHEKFATFLNGDGFYATLLLENVRPDLPMEVQVSVILESGEVPMQMLTLAAHSSRTIDISAFLEAHGDADARGTVCVRFSFSSYGPLIAAAQSYDTAHHIYMNSFAQSAEEYWAGTGYDGVIWAPDDGTKGFVSVMNTSFETKDVHVNFLADGHSQALPGIKIGPRQTYFLPIDDLIARSRTSGAGIHIQYDEYPGDIVVEGQLYNPRTGFAKNIHFADLALQYPTATLRTHFALLGEQPPEDGYPAGVSFSSVAAVRNVDTVPLTVTPNLKFLQTGTVQTVALSPLHLGVGESQIIDLSKAQESGFIPNDVHRATVELVPANNKGSIIAELFSFDGNTGGYVVGSSFTSYPSHSTSSIWRTDGTFQTEAAVENTADQNDVVTLKVFSQNGLSYLKKFPIAAGGLLDINLGQLQQDQVPDDSGRLLTGTSGIIQLVGSLHAQSKLSFAKIIHSTNEADYVGLPPNPCDFVEGIGLFLNGPGFGSDVSVMEAWDWSQAGGEDQPSTGAVSSNTSIAQITLNSSGEDVVTFTWPKGGTNSVTVSLENGSIEATDCDACSAGLVPVVPDTIAPPPNVSFSSISSVVVGQTATTTATVAPSNNTIPISLSISGGGAIVSPTGTFTSTTSVVVKGLSAGTTTITATVTNPESGGTDTVGSTSFQVVNPPSKLVRFNEPPCAPAGLGPLQVITNGSVVDCGGKLRASNFCGVNRNLTYILVDSTGAPFAPAYSLNESFSNLSTTNTALGLPAAVKKAPIPANGFVTDAQFVGSTYPTCLASNDHHSFTQKFSVVVNGMTYNLTTTVSISDGKFNGTAEDNVTTTVP